jgi:hypothetical protein
MGSNPSKTENEPNTELYQLKLTPTEMENIKKIAKAILNNPEINSLIPDFIEEKMYVKTLAFIFVNLKNILSTAKITFLENEITFNLKPK